MMKLASALYRCHYNKSCFFLFVARTRKPCGWIRNNSIQECLLQTNDRSFNSWEPFVKHFYQNYYLPLATRKFVRILIPKEYAKNCEGQELISLWKVIPQTDQDGCLSTELNDQHLNSLSTCRHNTL